MKARPSPLFPGGASLFCGEGLLCSSLAPAFREGPVLRSLEFVLSISGQAPYPRRREATASHSPR